MIDTIALCEMLGLLMRGSPTRPDIVRHTGLTSATVGKYLKVMHARRVVRIADWRRDAAGMRWLPCWTLNVGNAWNDIEKPAPLTQAQKDARRKQCLKTNGLTSMVSATRSVPSGTNSTKAGLSPSA